VRALTDTNDLPGFASHDDRDTIELIRDSGPADYDGEDYSFQASALGQ
jgi:hypothetical protein